MGVSAGFSQFVLEQMTKVAPVSLRRMFGGMGVYSGGLFFALLDEDTLFFKVDDSNRADFVGRGMEPFRPFGDERRSMQYYELPAEVLEDIEELREWMEKALAAARRGKSAKQKPGRAQRKTPASRKAATAAGARQGRGRGGRRGSAINKMIRPRKAGKRRPSGR